MERKTPIANDIDLKIRMASMDAWCKRILGNKSILAWILKECVEEFKDCEIKDIKEKYIEGEPEISSETVHQDEVLPERINGLNTEDKTVSEGTVTYDIKFTAIIPETDMKVHMYINVEAQKDFYPGYPLIKRAIYYCCRMVSSQYLREFTQSEYGKLKKVCSIWICTNPPESRKNTITEYAIQERTIVGNSTEKRENYDLIRGIMINLGDYNDSEGILKLLSALTSDQFEPEKKKEFLKNEFAIEMTQDIELGVNEMCNVAEGIYERGIQKGLQQGAAEHERKTVLRMLGKGKTDIEIIEAMEITEEQLSKYKEEFNNKQEIQC